MQQSIFIPDNLTSQHSIQDLYLDDGINEARLAMLMTDASIDQIMALDLSLKITAWNHACEQVTGIPREQATGRLFTELLCGVVEFPHVMEALVKALKGLKSFVPYEKAAYSGGYFEHHFIPLKSARGVIGVLIIIHDVAHRIKAEQELRRLNAELARKAKELQEKTDELTQFNWIASHDLKEPLRKIYTFIEMVATKEGIKLTDAARTNLRRAQSAAQRMGLLTDDIATFTQVAAPSEQLADVRLDEAFAAVINKHQRAIDNSGAVVDYPPMPTIKAYPEMLKLLFGHMLGNALKFHAEGAQPKVWISYTMVPGEQLNHPAANAGANYHCIGFQDNGIGFPPEYSEKIFGMFQRLNSEGTYKGTGMGLAICRKVAAAHGGFITVESEEGVGTTFYCYLEDILSSLAGRS